MNTHESLKKSNYRTGLRLRNNRHLKYLDQRRMSIAFCLLLLAISYSLFWCLLNREIFVYKDFNSAKSKFTYKTMISSSGGEKYVQPLDENWRNKPHAGNSCIKNQFTANGLNWAGWYFANLSLSAFQNRQDANWVGMDEGIFYYSTATELTFWARGEKGGESVEFFVSDVGGNANSRETDQLFNVLSPRFSTGIVKLTTGWRKYRIALYGSRLLNFGGGFGWVARAAENSGEVVFYLDDVAYRVHIVSPQTRYLRTP